MLIKNAVVHTMDGPVIDNGYVWIEGSRIAGTGNMADMPDEDTYGPVVDARGGHLTPGIIDAHCHLGMYGAGLGFEGDDLNEMADPCTPQLRALDGINPMDEYFAAARNAGITCVVTGPGSANAIGGQMMALKTVGRVADQMVVRAPVSMKFALGENPKKVHGRGRNSTPRTRMATAAIIREKLNKALEYGRKKAEAAEKGTDGPAFDLGLEALLPVLHGELPAHIHCHQANDIVTAVRLAREFDLDLTVVHGTEGHLIADFLARENVPVITGPSLDDKSKPELRNLTMSNTAVLAKAGVQVAICTDHPVTPINYLPLCAALAAKEGMDEEEALAAVTINAACIIKADDRLGSIAPCKDADLVLWSGHPFDYRSEARTVWIDGREVEG